MKKHLFAVYEYWLNWRLGSKITSSILSVTLLSVAVLMSTSYVINARQVTENTGSQWLILGDQVLERASDKITQEARVLETLAKTPSLVTAVRTANRERAGWNSQMILNMDQAWVDNDLSAEFIVRQVSANTTSDYLIDFQRSNPAQVEVFLTDTRGLNVAMTNRTSDFRQSDEDWWYTAFADGKGSTYLGPVEYDASSQQYAMEIAVPIMDPDAGAAIGVLRGTVDVSVLFDTLQDVRLGITGNVVVLDQSGTVLYSHDPEHAFKPAPQAILSLFMSGRRDWAQSVDMDGRPAIVAYSSLTENDGHSLGWRILFTQTLAEANQVHLRNILISFLASLLVVVTGVLIASWVIHNSLSGPIRNLTGLAHELSIGNIAQSADGDQSRSLSRRKDEIGEIHRAFDRLTNYFTGAAEAAASIANKDLTIKVNPNSDRDVLAVALAKMIAELNQVIGQVSQNARTVSEAASQLAGASDQSGKATQQIAMTMQQVASGTTQQSEEVSRTSGSVEHMNRVISEVAVGAREQARAVTKASTVALQISSTIQQVTAAAQSGARGAGEAADIAKNGAQAIQDTIAGMQTLKSKVGLSAEKVREMGERSEQIDAIVETIGEIASQTDLLALNAAIEAARVESKSEQTIQTMLQEHMLGAASLLAQLLLEQPEIDSRRLGELAHQAKVQDFFVSDEDGVIIASTNPGSLGFRFSEDPGQQSSAFRPLLARRDGQVVQPMQARQQDNKPFLFVGVSRRDRPGIIQAGMAADSMYGLVGYSRGFGVVADEIRKLSVHAKTSTKEITVLIRNIQKAVVEAMTVMTDASRDVESRSAQAMQAGESLASILQTVEAVAQQVGEIAAAVEHLGASSQDLVSAVRDVSSVVEQNTAATESMAGNSNQVTQALENIASVSEENSAAVEEVSASAEEVLAQAEEVSASAASLMEMAHGLQQVVAQFQLATGTDVALTELEAAYSPSAMASDPIESYIAT